MRRILGALITSAVTAAVAVGCSSSNSSGLPDAVGPLSDAGVVPDASSDALPAPDASSESDAGLNGDSGAAPDAEPEDSGVPCTPPSAAVLAELSTSIRLCAGVLSLPAAGPSGAASRITASGIEIACEGTVIESASGTGSTASPTIGFLIERRSNVTLRGCTARGFRYGLVARDASNLLIEGAHFDANFDDPQADWVQDSVQGGGLRLERVTSATVAESSFAHDWNGIELRESTGVVVRHNTADHCSNTGATLVATRMSRIEDNDMSWAIRGDRLSFPARWYRLDTKDSAGIIVDGGSDRNAILRNDFTHGGDGVFIRSVIGACATNNRVEGNNTSFSPHNAIECWCDGNEFIDNIASDSDYGVWLGGTDRGLVRGNTVERNLTDGISIQIGEDRHTVIDGNIIRDNGRLGILLTGREIQSWDPLTRVGPNLASSSHLIVERNMFSGNGPCPPLGTGACDVYITASRSVAMASNCSEGNLTTEAALGGEAEGVFSLGSCGGGQGGAGDPVAVLAEVTGHAGESIRLDASASSDPDGREVHFHWLVQRSGARFTPAVLPEAPLLGAGAATATVSFDAPGLWDVAVTVDDGAAAVLAWRTAAILPEGLELGTGAADWGYSCTTPGCMTRIEDDAVNRLAGASAVRVTTDEAFPFAFSTPPARDLHLDASGDTHLAAFFRAENPNPFGGWQGAFPTFVLGTSGGTLTYVPDVNLLPTSAGEWIYVDLPLAGGSGWTRTVQGTPILNDLNYIEIQSDTWDYRAYTIWIDALTLY